MTLEERFTEFVRNLQSAEIVDELKLSQEQERSKKPDFFFFERQFIGEMKSIKKDMEPKAQAILEKHLEKHKDRPEYPVFFGQWSSDKILKHLSDGESINEEIFYAITSALEDSVEKANRQIRETKKVFEISGSQGILIILNDFVEIPSPDLIAHKVHQLLNKKSSSGDARCPHISVVWIVSEIHIVKTEIGQELLPSIVLVNDYSHSHQEASDYVNWLQRKWASFNNMPFVEGHLDFKNVQFSKQKGTDSPEMIPRSEMWRKQYSQMPYLRRLSREQLLEYSQQLWFETLPAFIKGSHEKPAQEAVFELMEKQTHLMEEINCRGIDFREFSPSIHEAFNRLQQEGKLKI
ncbi:MAG: hypothetical protein KME10_27885 [Plectolyngbya sp. WJT66-NPBG17]|jgi:hypothetical protein|nr:hypothetical protein [Plectolyngbya sp. WJT66-NPBG17]